MFVQTSTMLECVVKDKMFWLLCFFCFHVLSFFFFCICMHWHLYVWWLFFYCFAVFLHCYFWLSSRPNPGRRFPVGLYPSCVMCVHPLATERVQRLITYGMTVAVVDGGEFAWSVVSGLRSNLCGDVSGLSLWIRGAVFQTVCGLMVWWDSSTLLARCTTSHHPSLQYFRVTAQSAMCSSLLNVPFMFVPFFFFFFD